MDYTTQGGEGITINNLTRPQCQLGQCTAASSSLVPALPASAPASDSSMARPGEDLLARMELNPELAPGGSGVPAINVEL